jgi:hypothetical protein
MNSNKVKVMKELEQKVNKQAVHISQIAVNEILTNPDKKKEVADVTSNKIINVISDGAKEFKEKVGRPMTYSEMREMFG